MFIYANISIALTENNIYTFTLATGAYLQLNSFFTYYNITSPSTEELVAELLGYCFHHGIPVEKNFMPTFTQLI